MFWAGVWSGAPIFLALGALAALVWAFFHREKMDEWRGEAKDEIGGDDDTPQ